MTKFWVFWRTFRIFFWNCTLALHIKLEQVVRPIDVLNRSRHVRNSTVKYKFIFFSRRRPWRRRRRCIRSIFNVIFRSHGCVTNILQSKDNIVQGEWGKIFLRLFLSVVGFLQLPKAKTKASVPNSFGQDCRSIVSVHIRKPFPKAYQS